MVFAGYFSNILTARSVKTPILTSEDILPEIPEDIAPAKVLYSIPKACADLLTKSMYLLVFTPTVINLFRPDNWSSGLNNICPFTNLSCAATIAFIADSCPLKNKVLVFATFMYSSAVFFNA